MAQDDRGGWLALGVVVAVAAAVLGAALLWSSAPETGAPAHPAAVPGPVAATPRSEPPPAESTHQNLDADPPQPHPAVDPALSAVIGAARPGELPPSTQAFASPAEASKFVEDRVVGLLAAVAPEIAAAEVEVSCESDGRTCTFRAPWPGDDLLKRWLKAISAGETSPEALGGVKFSTFRPVDGPGGQRELEIVAQAP